MKFLSTAQIEFFNTKGYIHCKEVFPREVALTMQEEIWQELEETFGINKNPETWRVPPHSPKKAKTSPLNKKIINTQFRGIIDELIGKENWKEPYSWGGFLVTFPTGEKEWHLAHKLWHFDYELHRPNGLHGLLIFSFYSDVPKQGGGTLIVSGSHLVLEKYYQSLSEEQKNWKHGQHRKHFAQWHPWLKELSNPKLKGEERTAHFLNKTAEIKGIPVQVMELTGKPGDVVFCHPRLLHAPAGINLNNYPRMMRTKFLW